MKYVVELVIWDAKPPNLDLARVGRREASQVAKASHFHHTPHLRQLLEERGYVNVDFQTSHRMMFVAVPAPWDARHQSPKEAK